MWELPFVSISGELIKSFVAELKLNGDKILSISAAAPAAAVVICESVPITKPLVSETAVYSI